MHSQQQQELLEPLQTSLSLPSRSRLAGFGTLCRMGALPWPWVFAESQPPVRNTNQDTNCEIQQFKRQWRCPSALCFWPRNFPTLPMGESYASPSLQGCSVPAHPSHPTHKAVIKSTIPIQGSIRGTWLPALAQTKSYSNRDPDSSLYLQKLLLQRTLREITVLCCTH